MNRSSARSALLAALLFVLGLGVGDARAQGAGAISPHGDLSAPGEIADAPSGVGTIRGQVIHRTRPEAAAGVPIVLFALGADGRPGTRQTESGPDGRFTFEMISNDPRTVYLLAVQDSEVPFGARVAFESGELERTAVIEIADTGTDAGRLGSSSVKLRLDRGCSGIRITEAHELFNPGDIVLVVPPEQRAAASPLFKLRLPEGAIGVVPGRSLAEGGLEQRGEDVVFWGPLYPGKHAIDFSYSLAGGGPTLGIERRFPVPVEEVTVMTWADGPPARGEALTPGDVVEVDGVRYATMKHGALAAGDPLAFEFDLAPGGAEDAARLSISEATIWLEIDDAALDVREEISFDIEGSAALRSDSDAPLLCLALPPGAENLRFSGDAFAMGIQPDAAGGLALRGPIRAGRTDFAFSYLLRTREGATRFERTFPVEVPLFSLYIADTGVRTATDRLHRRRPARTTDRTYIHLEAFQVEAGETITLDLESVSPPQPLPRLAAVGAVASAAILSVFFLSAPLRKPRESLPRAQTAGSTATERASIYSAIRDLGDDFETGKISREDHDAMMKELRARAGELLREERAPKQPQLQPQQKTAATAAAQSATAKFCSQCGGALTPNARFCSHCGERLSTAASGPGTPE